MDDKRIAEVNRSFNARKKEREAKVVARRAEIYAKLPRIKEIDDAIWAGGLAMMSAVWEGESPESVVAQYAARTEAGVSEKRALLVRAGYPADYLEPPYTCVHCKDTGKVGDKLCSCYLSLLTEALYQESNMGQLLRAQTFQKFDLRVYDTEPVPGKAISPRENMKTIFSVCKNYAEQFGKHHDSLILYGNPGLGKTFLSSAIANTLLEKGFSVLYQSAGQVFDTLASVRFGRNDEAADHLLKHQLMQADLLIIDDLGTEFINSMTEADLFYVINGRILAEKCTIISTNMHLPDISRQYSDRILSRILGHYTPLYFYGTDIRSLG